MNKKYKYGFIGCGNMGFAIARAVCASGCSVIISDTDTVKAKKAADELGCEFGTNETVAASCEGIFLAVKPQVIEKAVSEIKEVLCKERPLLITMAAGVEISVLEKLTDGKLPVIRIMPNTPVSVGKGMVLYCASSLVTDAMLSEFVGDMRFSGELDKIEEKLIDAGCALSGCGPAYMYMFAEALADGAVACGLPRDKAIKYAATTMAGSAELLLASNKGPGALKDAVCSPGGTTIMGVKALEEGGLRAAAMNAVMEAFKRNKELM